LIFRNYASTGDGLLTGMLLADLVKRSGETLSQLGSKAMVRFPQVLVNVSVTQAAEIAASEAVAEAVAKAEVDLDGEGRIMVRASGTEPVVRVMVEAGDTARATAIAQGIATVVAETSDALLFSDE
jgi:phosphoglucosamine mutase